MVTVKYKLTWQDVTVQLGSLSDLKAIDSFMGSADIISIVEDGVRIPITEVRDGRYWELDLEKQKWTPHNLY